MLIDEVLAVGDASFAQKCMDVFREKRAAGQDDRARHPRHGDRPGLLRPRDGHPRRRAALPRRPRGGGAALLPAELRRRRSDAHARARRRARRQRAVVDALARERGRRARRERRAGRADRASAPSSRRATTSRRRSSASTSSTRTGRTVFGFNRALERALVPRASACASRARSRTRCCPGRYSVDAVGRRATATQGDLALHMLRLLDFVVYGTRPGAGSVWRRRRRSRRAVE